MTTRSCVGQHGHQTSACREQLNEIERLKACLTGAATAFTELGYLGLSEAMIAARDGRPPATVGLEYFTASRHPRPGG